MRQDKRVSRSQHTLPFVRREIWQSLPAEQRRQCSDLCRQLLRAIIEYEEAFNREDSK